MSNLATAMKHLCSDYRVDYWYIDTSIDQNIHVAKYLASSESEAMSFARRVRERAAANEYIALVDIIVSHGLDICWDMRPDIDMQVVSC